MVTDCAFHLANAGHTVTPAKTLRPEIENKELKRTGQSISLIFSKMNAISGNELLWVNPFFYSGIGLVSKKKFVRPLLPIGQERQAMPLLGLRASLKKQDLNEVDTACCLFSAR